jgi:hypothetical protein
MQESTPEITGAPEITDAQRWRDRYVLGMLIGWFFGLDLLDNLVFREQAQEDLFEAAAVGAMTFGYLLLTRRYPHSAPRARRGDLLMILLLLTGTVSLVLRATLPAVISSRWSAGMMAAFLLLALLTARRQRGLREVPASE